MKLIICVLIELRRIDYETGRKSGSGHRRGPGHRHGPLRCSLPGRGPRWPYPTSIWRRPRRPAGRLNRSAEGSGHRRQRGRCQSRRGHGGTDRGKIRRPGHPGQQCRDHPGSGPSAHERRRLGPGPGREPEGDLSLHQSGPAPLPQTRRGQDRQHRLGHRSRWAMRARPIMPPPRRG